MKNTGWPLTRATISDVVVIDVVGDIDFREMMRIKEIIGALIEKDRIKVIMNLAGVDCVNYLSLGILIERLRILRNLGGDLKLAGLTVWVRDIIRRCGLDGNFEIYRSIEEAIVGFETDWEGTGQVN